MEPTSSFNTLLTKIDEINLITDELSLTKKFAEWRKLYQTQSKSKEDSYFFTMLSLQKTTEKKKTYKTAVILPYGENTKKEAGEVVTPTNYKRKQLRYFI